MSCKLQVQVLLHDHLRAIYLIFKRFCTHESAFLWELSLEKYFSSELSHLIWGRKVGRWCPWDAIYVGGVKRRSSFAYFFKFIGRLRFQGNSTHFNGHIYCTLNAQLSYIVLEANFRFFQLCYEWYEWDEMRHAWPTSLDTTWKCRDWKANRRWHLRSQWDGLRNLSKYASSLLSKRGTSLDCI